MADPQAASQLLFQAGQTAEGKLVWSSTLTPAQIHLVLSRILYEIVSGQVKFEATPDIVPGTNGDLKQLDGLKKRMGL